MEDGTWKKLYQKWFPGSPDARAVPAQGRADLQPDAQHRYRAAGRLAVHSGIAPPESTYV